MNNLTFSWDTAIQISLTLIIIYLLIQLIPFYIKNLTRKKKLKRGVEKEKEAYKIIEKLGFKVIGQNVKYQYNILENQIETKIRLEIDYLVKKNKKTYIIEVKTGNSATRITNSSTRRQILEYSLFVPNDGIYLLDMDNEQLFEINFPHAKTNNKVYKSKISTYIVLILTLILIESLLDILPKI